MIRMFLETMENNYGVVKASKFMTVFTENERLVRRFKPVREHN